MDEDDIYGEDIYGMSAYGSSDAGRGKSYEGGTNGAETSALQKSLAEKDARCIDLERHLESALLLVEQWKSIIREAVPGTFDPRSFQDPASALKEFKRYRASFDKPVNEDIALMRQRESALQVQLAERNLENVELRRHTHTAQQFADPNIAQIQHLLLDPAVQKEFERMKSELEKAAKEMKTLQEELQAVQFSQDSKAGRMLMAKCRALQDENEEMGKELAEGKVHALERQVVLSKRFVEDMRARYIELEDHTHQLDDENEDLHQQIFMLRRQLREVESRSLPNGRERERPLRPLGAVPRPGVGSVGPLSPRGGFEGPPLRRFDGPPLSPDMERKHGLPRDLHPRYDKRLR